MNSQMALDLAYLVILTCAKASAPFLITAVVVGVLVNIIQTVTSIKDMSLTFVPKIVAAAVVGALALPWILQVMLGFFQEITRLVAQAGA